MSGNDTRVAVDVSRAAIDEQVAEIGEHFDLNIEQMEVLQLFSSWFRANDDTMVDSEDDTLSHVALVHGVFGSGKRFV